MSNVTLGRIRNMAVLSFTKRVLHAHGLRSITLHDVVFRSLVPVFEIAGETVELAVRHEREREKNNEG